MWEGALVRIGGKETSMTISMLQPNDSHWAEMSPVQTNYINNENTEGKGYLGSVFIYSAVKKHCNIFFCFMRFNQKALQLQTLW